MPVPVKNITALLTTKPQVMVNIFGYDKTLADSNQLINPVGTARIVKKTVLAVASRTAVSADPAITTDGERGKLLKPYFDDTYVASELFTDASVRRNQWEMARNNVLISRVMPRVKSLLRGESTFQHLDQDETTAEAVPAMLAKGGLTYQDTNKILSEIYRYVQSDPASELVSKEQLLSISITCFLASLQQQQFAEVQPHPFQNQFILFHKIATSPDSAPIEATQYSEVFRGFDSVELKSTLSKTLSGLNGTLWAFVQAADDAGLYTMYDRLNPLKDYKSDNKVFLKSSLMDLQKRLISVVTHYPQSAKLSKVLKGDFQRWNTYYYNQFAQISDLLLAFLGIRQVTPPLDANARTALLSNFKNELSILLRNGHNMADILEAIGYRNPGENFNVNLKGLQEVIRVLKDELTQSNDKVVADRITITDTFPNDFRNCLTEGRKASLWNECLSKDNEYFREFLTATQLLEKLFDPKVKVDDRKQYLAGFKIEFDRLRRPNIQNGVDITVSDKITLSNVLQAFVYYSPLSAYSPQQIEAVVTAVKTALAKPAAAADASKQTTPDEFATLKADFTAAIAKANEVRPIRESMERGNGPRTIDIHLEEAQLGKEESIDLHWIIVLDRGLQTEIKVRIIDNDPKHFADNVLNAKLSQLLEIFYQLQLVPIIAQDTSVRITTGAAIKAAAPGQITFMDDHKPCVELATSLGVESFQVFNDTIIKDLKVRWTEAMSNLQAFIADHNHQLVKTPNGVNTSIYLSIIAYLTAINSIASILEELPDVVLQDSKCVQLLQKLQDLKNDINLDDHLEIDDESGSSTISDMKALVAKFDKVRANLSEFKALCLKLPAVFDSYQDHYIQLALLHKSRYAESCKFSRKEMVDDVLKLAESQNSTGFWTKHTMTPDELKRVEYYADMGCWEAQQLLGQLCMNPDYANFFGENRIHRALACFQLAYLNCDNGNESVKLWSSVSETQKAIRMVLLKKEAAARKEVEDKKEADKTKQTSDRKGELAVSKEAVATISGESLSKPDVPVCVEARLFSELQQSIRETKLDYRQLQNLGEIYRAMGYGDLQAGKVADNNPVFADAAYTLFLSQELTPVSPDKSKEQAYAQLKEALLRGSASLPMFAQMKGCEMLKAFFTQYKDAFNSSNINSVEIEGIKHDFQSSHAYFDYQDARSVQPEQVLGFGDFMVARYQNLIRGYESPVAAPAPVSQPVPNPVLKPQPPKGQPSRATSEYAATTTAKTPARPVASTMLPVSPLAAQLTPPAAPQGNRVAFAAGPRPLPPSVPSVPKPAASKVAASAVSTATAQSVPLPVASSPRKDPSALQSLPALEGKPAASLTAPATATPPPRPGTPPAQAQLTAAPLTPDEAVAPVSPDSSLKPKPPAAGVGTATTPEDTMTPEAKAAVLKAAVGLKKVAAKATPTKTPEVAPEPTPPPVAASELPTPVAAVTP